MSRPITRSGRLVRIGVGILLVILNGISLGGWLDPILGWTISGAIWMGLNFALSLYVAYHFVQLIRQSNASE